MIIDREDRAVFAEELRNRRQRGGRPRSSDPMVPMTVRVPGEMFDAACRRAQREGRSLPEVIRGTLAREFSYSFTGRPSNAC